MNAKKNVAIKFLILIAIWLSPCALLAAPGSEESPDTVGVRLDELVVTGSPEESVISGQELSG